MYDATSSSLTKYTDAIQLLLHLGDDVTPEEIDEMLQEADFDGDGLIKIDHFVKAWVMMCYWGY